MANFMLTPTDLNLTSSIFRDPITGQWILPLYTFNTNYQNSFLIESDPLNNDQKYQERVIDNIFFRLTEKWLYKSSGFIGLLKFFILKTDGDKGTITLVDDPD
ncbi:MAG: hypothetical protein EOP34_05485, partial [Rickettsiales bacterium]